MSLFARDAWYWPFYLVAGSNAVHITELEGIAINVVATFGVGRWYAHHDATLHAAGYRGLFHALEDALNNGSNADVTISSGTPNKSYTFSARTPTASTGVEYGGLRISSDDTNFDLRLESSTTLDARHLGYKGATLSADVDSSAGTGLIENIDSPNCIRGRILTQTISPDGNAETKDREPYVDLRRASSRPRNAPSPVIWDEGYRRTWVYPQVRGGVLLETRSQQAAYASFVGLETGDGNQAWEPFYKAMIEGEHLICVHDNHDDLEVSSHSYDIGVMSDVQSEHWRDFARKTHKGGDRHTVSFTLDLIENFQNYPH